MWVLAQLFWVLVLLMTLHALQDHSRHYNRHGTLMLLTPVGWYWVITLGVLILLQVLRWSPWHLLWWLPVGSLGLGIYGRLLARSHIPPERTIGLLVLSAFVAMYLLIRSPYPVEHEVPILLLALICLGLFLLYTAIIFVLMHLGHIALVSFRHWFKTVNRVG